MGAHDFALFLIFIFQNSKMEEGGTYINFSKLYFFFEVRYLQLYLIAKVLVSNSVVMNMDIYPS